MPIGLSQAGETLKGRRPLVRFQQARLLPVSARDWRARAARLLVEAHPVNAEIVDAALRVETEIAIAHLYGEFPQVGFLQ